MKQKKIEKCPNGNFFYGGQTTVTILEEDNL